jgi:gamma-glutamylaminecyclotransferase
MKTIFVYGTLKRGFPNYNKQRLSQFYIGNCTTVTPYSLLIADQYYVPVLLLDATHGNKRIKGELYRVDQNTLAWLDALEGVGKNKGYQRVEIEVLAENGEIILANAYMKYRKDIDVIHNQLSTQYELDSRYIIPALR